MSILCTLYIDTDMNTYISGLDALWWKSYDKHIDSEDSFANFSAIISMMQNVFLSPSHHSLYSYFLIFSLVCILAFINMTQRSYYIHYKYITWHGGKGSMIAMQIKKDFKVFIFAKHITSVPSPCNEIFKPKE